MAISRWRRDALVALHEVIGTAAGAPPLHGHKPLETRRPRRVFVLLIFFFLSSFHSMCADHRLLPHLEAYSRHPMVFLTVVTHDRRTLLACQAAHDLLMSIWNRSASMEGWFVGRYVLMPDHVHFFARPTAEAKTLSDWVRTWKSLSSRQIAIALRTTQPFWQKNYFDRFLRSTDNYEEKWHYVEMNPVRKGLCSQPAEWPWQGELFELRF
jgi:REP element-mobilizing transposase RayT